MNGVGIKAIAARVHSRPGSVQAYLASRAGLPNERRLGPIRASLKDTVLEALPGENYFTDCIVSISRAVSRRLALICSDRALRSICAHSIR
jgi:hypothetical protein